MSHEKYLKKALISLGISDMIKEIPDFKKLEELLSFLEKSIIQFEYEIIECKDAINNFDYQKQQSQEVLDKINSMLSDATYYRQKKELLKLKEQLQDAIYEHNENYNYSKERLSILPNSLKEANRLLSLFQEVEPQCRVEEIKALNKGKNYEFFAVA